MDDMVEVLAQMKELCPKDDNNGKPPTARFPFNDWTEHGYVRCQRLPLSTDMTNSVSAFMIPRHRNIIPAWKKTALI